MEGAGIVGPLNRRSLTCSHALRTPPRKALVAITATALILAGTALAATPSTAADPEPSRIEDPDSSAGSEGGPQAFLLQLDTRSTGRAFQARRPAGLAAARTAARAQLARVRAAQDEIVAELPPQSDVMYRTHALMSGVAVRADGNDLDELLALPGVTQVLPIAEKSRTNGSALSLQGAPGAWEAHGNRGAGVSISIIDTGIDYTHATFGGAGCLRHGPGRRRGAGRGGTLPEREGDRRLRLRG